MQLKYVVISCAVAGLIGCGEPPLKEIVEKTYPSGKPKQVSYFRGGAKAVRTVFYFENGSLQGDQYFDKDGKPDSIKVILYPSGQKYKETFYKNGRINGTDKSWYEDGKPKSEAAFVNDTPQGVGTTYYPNGQKASETPYKNGKKDGLELKFNDKGDTMHLMTYVAGDPMGSEKIYYPNGKLKLEQTWKKNMLDGPYSMYYQSGVKNEEGTYAAGKYQGKRYMYNEKGRKISEATFDKGVLTEGETF